MTDTIEAVAMDGPAGAGKSSIAKHIATACGYLYVDTGAMYRAVTLKALRAGIDLENPGQMLRIATASDIAFDPSGAQVIVDGINVSQDIRSPEVARHIKYAARVPQVRARLVALQQAMAERRPVVMEGRDITTVVLPRARWKFFLDASPKVRAERRYAEMQAAGRDIGMDELLADINQRDAADYQVGPMRDARDRALAGDGIRYLDTSEMSAEEVMTELLRLMREQVH